MENGEERREKREEKKNPNQMKNIFSAQQAFRFNGSGTGYIFLPFLVFFGVYDSQNKNFLQAQQAIWLRGSETGIFSPF